MVYERFVKEITSAVEAIVDSDFNVVVRTVKKNNGVNKKALSIIKPSVHATPTIYLDRFFNDYKSGTSITSLAKEIVLVYRKGMEQFDKEIDIDHILDFDKIKHRVFYKVVNYELNKTLLADVPHKKIMDLAIVYYLEVSSTGEGNATALIHYYHIGHWGVTEEKLDEIAFENTTNKRKPSIIKIEEIIKEIIMDEVMEGVEEGCMGEEGVYAGKKIDDIEAMVEEEINNYKDEFSKEMYVLTNDIRFNGAACMFYPNLIADFAEEKGSDLYIIPSSIHEVLLVPKYSGGKERLTEILNEVNDKEVDPMEVLSDRLYEYNREDGEIK